ncbi:c-type cytochrome [Mucilaginibacter paludis]|uniref:Photosynthetic reaction center cytochrome c subunit n=1 Tax=Mucilaginibacter paludis DSM 18603 TaxID=714943 RepID=H1Y5Y5_9SPHI|nr:c-type cytochrome [Mucilaginibacter paludis]EHQ30407.1 hypothetical protein Mucpa_6353 [Mucilaginibacter paludis DSM 18603]
MIHYKKLFVTICLSGTVVFAATASMQNEPEKPQWKNLKVLPKNISKEDLDKVMDEWKEALGVRCGFCHARNEETKRTDFASDAKPEKEMARKMMTMTAKINKKYFKADKNEKEMVEAISCYTCHHGAAHPDATPAPREHRGPGGPGANGQLLPPPPPTPPSN